MINKTGMIVAVYKGEKFDTIEPDGQEATLIEFKSSPYAIDGVMYVDSELGGIRNLPDETGEEILVNKEVALYGWLVGRYDLVYLDGTLVTDKRNKTVASQTLVRYNKK